MTDPRIEAAAIAMRSTIEFKAGASFGLPADAYEQYSSALATAALAAIDKAATITTVEELDALPEESVIRSSFGTIYERDFIIESGRRFWAGIGHDDETPSTRIGLPAHVIHWGTDA